MTRRRGDAAKRHAARLKAVIVDNGGEFYDRQRWFREANLTVGQGNAGYPVLMSTDSGTDGTMVAQRRGPKPARYVKTFDHAEQDAARLRKDISAYHQLIYSYANARACLEQVDKYDDPDRWHELMTEQERAEEAMSSLEKKMTRTAKALNWSDDEIEALFRDVPEDARA